jgi:cytochrome P450
MLMRMTDDTPRRLFLEDRDLAPRMVDEALRRDPPIHYEGRTSTEDVVMGGAEIKAGEKVALLYASGNHDEEVYPDPERFDPLREGPLHLSFGHGIHKCLGEHLSRLEMGIVLEEMFARFPGYRLTGEPAGGGMVYGHHMAWDSVPAAMR